jgi:hypothetical protein
MSAEDSLWAALVDPEEAHSHFACAMLLKRRGHKRLPLRLVDPNASPHDLGLAFVEGLRALRDPRTQGLLSFYAEQADADDEVDILVVALRALLELGRITVPFDVSKYVSSYDLEVRLLANAAAMMRV